MHRILQRFQGFSATKKALVMGCFAFLIVGCGTAVYEERLEFTQKYYDYIDRMNRNLAPQYNNSGVSIRVPLQFSLIPAPPPRPKKAEGDEGEEPARDPRQPEFLESDLPGLISAWQANLTTVGAGGETAQQTGYLFLLGNYEYWQKFKGPNDIGDPLKFHEDSMNTLVNELEIAIDNRQQGTATDRVNKWFNEVVPEPADEEFAPRKEFTTITLVPERNEENEEEAGPAREYQVYLYQNGDMHIALVYVLPRNVSAGEELENRKLLSLQTVDVASQKPARTGGRANPIAGGEAGAEGTPPPAQPNNGVNF